MQEDRPQFGITYTSTTVVYLKIKAIKYIHKPDIFFSFGCVYEGGKAFLKLSV